MLVVGLGLALGGCQKVEDAWINVAGKKVSNPEKETEDWVLMEAMKAARNDNAERGWERFQKVLHTSERTPNALRGWYKDAWPRMRRQVSHYDFDGKGSFEIVGVKTMSGSDGSVTGREYRIKSSKKQMPTPCAVYIDAEQGGAWRIRRCSL